MLNTEMTTANRTALWSEVPELKGGASSYQVTDAWTGKSLGCIKDQYSVALSSHDAAVLIVQGSC